MIKPNSLVIYKNTAAVVLSVGENNKFSIKFQSVPATATKPAVYETQNVRAKDILLLNEGPASSLESVLKFAVEKCPSASDIYNLEQTNEIFLQIKDCYELLSGESPGESYPFNELVSLFRGEVKPDEAWGLYCALKNTVYFSQVLKDQLDGKIAFTVRPQQEIDSLVKKAGEKEKEAELRSEFIQRLKTGKLLPEDSVFMGDVEALALGKTDKSRTMHDAGLIQDFGTLHAIRILCAGDFPQNQRQIPLILRRKKSGLSLTVFLMQLTMPGQLIRTMLLPLTENIFGFILQTRRLRFSQILLLIKMRVQEVQLFIFQKVLPECFVKVVLKIMRLD